MTTTCGCQMQLWGVPRSVVIFYACAVACKGRGEATRRAASWQGFLFLRVGPQQWHMNALPRAHITSSSAALLSHTHTHITVSPSLLHFFHCHFHFTWSQMSSTTSSCGPGNCFSCSSRCYAFSSFNTLPPFSLSFSLSLSPLPPLAFIICTLTLFRCYA